MTGSRETSGSFKRLNTDICNVFFGENYPNKGVEQVYNEIVALLVKHNTIPGFMSESKTAVTKELAFTDGKYSITLTDENNMLAEYDFTSASSNVTVAKSGNKLIITAAKEFDGTVQLTATRNNLPTVSETARLLAYGDADLQDVVIGVENMDTVKAYMNVEAPSGCGKTTILRLINGLIPQFYPGEVIGDILIDGEETKGKELYDTALKVGTVFQNPRTQFYNVDTTGELAFGCENQGLPAEEIYTRIDKTVARFHMDKLMDRSIFHLSDGEKQKVACASVDVSDTSIILLDEPSANLDYDATLVLREMMMQWKAAGKTIIAAEHRIAYLWDIIDRAVIMRHGRIVRELVGSEKDVLTSGELYSMGLRTTMTESPSDIKKDTFRKEDIPITIKKFRFSYRGKKQPIVDIPLLQLAEGEITAIVGANGAGKTSLLNCLCGLEKHCKGKLQYKGKSYGRKARRKLCFMVMQDTGNQLFTESAWDEVLISLPKNTAHEKEKALEILQSLDLADYTDRHPQSLSGGQKQRLAIACALASGRKILLLDEPTSGLDYAHMQETATLLRQLRDMGTTILVVTHDSELIRACCERSISL